jgi:hypothetical protein
MLAMFVLLASVLSCALPTWQNSGRRLSGGDSGTAGMRFFGGGIVTFITHSSLCAGLVTLYA